MEPGDGTGQHAFLQRRCVPCSTILRRRRIQWPKTPSNLGRSSGPVTIVGYLYSGGTFTTIADPLATGFTIAYGINDSSQIAGTFSNGSGLHGFLYDSGTYTTLDHPLAAQWTQGLGINNAGQIVGVYVDGGGGVHGFVYDHGAYTTIADPVNPNFTEASGINDLGQVVGWTGVGAGAVGFVATPDTPPPVDQILNGGNGKDVLTGGAGKTPSPAASRTNDWWALVTI